MSEDRSARPQEAEMRSKGYRYYGTMGKILAEQFKQGMSTTVKFVKTDIVGRVDVYYKPKKKSSKR